MYEHVDIHQDEHIEEEDFSWEAILNREANILASKYLVGTSPYYVQPIPAAKIQVTIDNTVINSN